ncbi:MAG: hypothetical protein P1S60_03995 [Anaerolineae bacterium]|nr:hypothetical protein [Anaerolineae bacterium]
MVNTEAKSNKTWGTYVLVGFLLLGAMYLWFVDTAPVVLSWETASEVGTAGFNVYRAEIETQQFIQVNDELIPAEGDETLGAAYKYEDFAVSPMHRYRYRIEEVEWDGGRQLYPDTVSVRAGLTRVWRPIEGAVLFGLAVLLVGWSWRKNEN